MNISLIILFVVGVLSVMVEIAHYMVVGGILSEKEVDVFLGKHMPDYINNGVGDGLFYGGLLPFIGRMPSIRSRWYIRGYGCISRWSRWSKELDKNYVKLRKGLNNL